MQSHDILIFIDNGQADAIVRVEAATRKPPQKLTKQQLTRFGVGSPKAIVRLFDPLAAPDIYATPSVFYLAALG